LAPIRVIVTDLPILYSFRRCPYAMRARTAVWQAGITVELREIVLRDKPPEMLAVSPKGTVPVLVLPDGKVIDESLDIMRWSLSQNDPGRWLDRVDMDLISANDGPFKESLDRYKYPNRYGLEHGTTFRDAAMDELKVIEKRLENQAYLSGEKLGFNDLAIAPFVRQFAATDLTWFDTCDLSCTRRWLAEFLALPIFQAAMIRYPVWQSGDDPSLFVQ
jgi:glutathione S-transferase